MICRSCGAICPETAEKCSECGAVLVSTAAQYRQKMQEADPQQTNPVRLRRESIRSSFAQEYSETAARSSARRRASQRPDETAKPEENREGGVRKRGSKPPAGESRRETRPLQEDAGNIRMVRQYDYEAIRPRTDGYEHFNWIRLCVVSFVCVAFLTLGIYLFFGHTSRGQYTLAQMGREADAQAYYELGCELMDTGSILSAVNALEIAQAKEPENLEILSRLGKAYLGCGRYEDAELAFSHAITKWQAYPEPYSQMTNLMLEQGRKYEALQVIEMAIENTDDSYFTTLQNQLLPSKPSVSVLGATFAMPFDLTISKTGEGKIYYSILGKDPVEEGIEYTGPVFLDEGTWKVRAVTVHEGLISKEQTQTYIINKPAPDMPKTNVSSGTYSSVREVSLRAGSDAVAIYYTMDGTTPTVESKKYEGPITLRIGKTVLRAIAVNAEGKVSNVMEVEYKCDGPIKKSMQVSDVIDKLSLNSTTQSKFLETYGQPKEILPDGEDKQGVYSKYLYDFGYAVFLDPETGKEPKLVELYVTSPDFQGPRNTRVGSSMEDVLTVFRDEGGEANVRGDRVLYTLTIGNIGLLTKLEGENNYQISYYCKLESGAYIDLTYIIDAGIVVSMEWVWYIPA